LVGRLIARRGKKGPRVGAQSLKRLILDIMCRKRVQIHSGIGKNKVAVKSKWVETNQSNFRIYPMDIRLSLPHGTMLTAYADVCADVARY
jgi:hypothetical protein